MNNPLGIHYGSFVKDWGDDQLPVISKVKELGFDLFEFGAPWLVEQSDASIAAFRKEAEANDMQIVLSLGLSTAQDISSNDPAIRKTGLPTSLNRLDWKVWKYTPFALISNIPR